MQLPQEMQRAMSKQADAEREKRAKIIHASGEFEATARLAEAAVVVAKEPVAIQLRYLQTLTEIGVAKNTTVISPSVVIFIKDSSSGREKQRPVVFDPKRRLNS